MKTIRLKTEFIKLDQLLKLADIAGSGGEAKGMILEGLVTVNGEPELRRGRKLYAGDRAETAGETIRVVK
ncbi:MAG: RNA-binding S4 domain-containing protein [Fusobacteriaceae bacterium]|jgi:ribosome-associated protein|nr:RNA-binding S4 domain-containing protein [Fusobacteriaceae bacterium]